MAYTTEERRRYNREWVAGRRAAWIASRGGRCVQCGSSERLEIDHIDPKTKAFNPANLWTRRREVRDAELAKCQVLCHDCHLDKTFGSVERGHGTRYAYREAGCRCPECRACNAAEARERRARKK